MLRVRRPAQAQHVHFCVFLCSLCSLCENLLVECLVLIVESPEAQERSNLPNLCNPCNPWLIIEKPSCDLRDLREMLVESPEAKREHLCKSVQSCVRRNTL